MKQVRFSTVRRTLGAAGGTRALDLASRGRGFPLCPRERAVVRGNAASDNTSIPPRANRRSALPSLAKRLTTGLLLGLLVLPGAGAEVTLSSPGLSPSRMDDQGRLVEDWGAIGIRLTGEGFPGSQAFAVSEVKLDDRVPAADARQGQGAITCTVTAFRAPVWPSGLDVLTVAVEEGGGRESACKIALDLPPKRADRRENGRAGGASGRDLACDAACDSGNAGLGLRG